MKNGMTIGLLLLLLAAITLPPCSGKKKSKSGAQIFSQYCLRCHVGGGNIVKSSKPLTGSKILDNMVQFKAYLSSPPGHMPHYQELTSDKEAIQALYDYCKTLAARPAKQS